MNEEKKNGLYRIYLIGFFLILALPLISSPVLLHPTAWGKAIFFRIIISILIFLFIYQLLYKKNNNTYSTIVLYVLQKKSRVFWSFWLLIALFLVFLLATIFSLDPRFSFWGSPLRGDGFLNLGLIIIFSILIFLILKKSDWQKIWDFSILIGLLVSTIALFQKFNIFGSFIKYFGSRPPGTMGGPIFLGLYLLLLLFITFSFFLKEKGGKKRLFYLLASLLFVYVIYLTGSRAAYFGLFIGLTYFILTFPKKNKLIIFLKILFIILSLSGTYGFYYLNLHNLIPGRFSIKMAADDPRFSAWLISIEAIKDYPFRGYGPENFSIAFDKYYSPSLPFISKEWGSWYDRAHSFIFEITATAGIPALIIYFGLFAVLFWQLQKLKDNPNLQIKSKSTNIIIHGVQATFFAYLSANLFSFDVFSTYLILFLIIGYSLSLIRDPGLGKLTETRVSEELKPGKPLILSSLLIFLIFFIWFGCLKPLNINAEINLADRYLRTNQCRRALEKMEADVLPTNSVINSYAKLKYVEMVENCNVQMPGLKKSLAPKIISLLEEVKEIRPYYTRTYILLGKYNNILIENKDYFKINDIEEIKEKADSYFEKASQLSPNREDVVSGQIQNDIILEQYQSAREKTQECLRLNPESKYCRWLRIISNLYLGEIERVHEEIEKGFNITSEIYLSQFKTICEKTENIECFGELSDALYSLKVYEEYRSDPEYHFNLIYTSSKGKKEEILKETINNILIRWPELKSRLKDSFSFLAEINQKTVEQYIDNAEKLIKIRNDLIESNASEKEIIDALSSEEEYIANKKLKLIK